jgi:capsular exopolysaccharide synthesis family protein
LKQDLPPVDQRASPFGEGSDDIDLADIARTLKRKWRTIAIFAGSLTLLALIFVMLSAPMFSVSGLLYFGNAQLLATPQQGNSTNLLTTFQNVTDVPTAVELLQANELLEKAILETGMNVDVEPEGESPPAFWQWKFFDHSAIDTYKPGPRRLIIQYATFADPGSPGGEYRLRFGDNGSYRLLPAAGNGPAVLTGTLREPAAGPNITMFVDTAIRDAPMPRAGATYDVSITPAKTLAAGLIGGALDISQVGAPTAPTNTALIQLLWNDPFLAQKFVNQLMKDFIATQLSWTTEAASNAETYVASQLAKVQASLSDADNKLAAYQAQTGILDVPANAQAVIGQLSQYQVQRTTALLQQQAYQQLLKSINAAHGGGINPYLVSTANDPTLTQLAGNLANAQIQLQSQSVQYTAQSPEVQAQQATINKTESAIKTLLQNDEAQAGANVANLQQQIAQYQNQLKSMPAQSLQIIELTQASQVYGQLYVLLMQNEEEAEVSKASSIVDTRIAAQAEVPLGAAKPNYKIFVLAGIFLGLIGGVALVLSQRVLSGRFHSENDVRRHLTLPIFGLIPARPKRGRNAGVFPVASKDQFAEAFRLLRSRLYQMNGAASSHVFLVTSAETGDGRTTVAVNLAKAFADDGKRVLLLDADLHRGHLHETLGLPQSPGLSEWLLRREKTPLLEVKGQSFLALPAGKYAANPSELLSDPMLDVIFKVLRADFDYIIVECPPLPRVADTLILLKHADLALSVLFIEKTSRAGFAAHLETYGAASVRRGIVINGLLDPAKQKAPSYGQAMPTKSWRTLWR